MPFLFEAWVHTPEAAVPLEPYVQDTCVHLFYGSETTAVHAPIVPLGFSEFLTRVRAYNQDQGSHKAIRSDQAAAFYNRQSIVQIFFRIPASQYKALP
jgi:hypothetical protein